MPFPWHPRVRSNLQRLNDALAARGTTLLMVRLPPRGLVHPEQVDRSDPAAAGFDPDALRDPYERHLDRLEQAGIEVVDLMGPIDDAGESVEFYHRRDHHWSLGGAALAAHSIAEHLRALPGGDALPPAQFDVREGAPVAKRGSLAAQVEALCGPLDVLDEHWPTRQSVAVASCSAALLGDAAAPAVTIVGSSNVKFGSDRFFVAGSLRQALGADVLNAGIDRVGMWHLVYEYLDSQEFRESPPRFLVWVSFAHIPFDSSLPARRLTPGVLGACDDPVFTGVVDLTQAGREPLSVPAGLRGEAAYLVLDTDDPALTRYDLVLQDTTGARDRVRIHHKPYLPPRGRAYLNLAPAQGDLESISVRAPRGGGSLTVRACVWPEPPAESGSG